MGLSHVGVCLSFNMFCIINCFINLYTHLNFPFIREGKKIVSYNFNNSMSLTKNIHIYIGSVWIELIVAENWKLKTENTVAK